MRHGQPGKRLDAARALAAAPTARATDDPPAPPPLPPQGARELAALSPAAAAAERAHQELRGTQFRAVTAYNRLRDDVARLGTPADTPELRRRLAGSAGRVRELAAQFRAQAEAHPAKEGVAAQKAVRDFQALLASVERLMATAREKEAAALPRAARGGGGAAAAAAAADEAGRGGVEREALLEAARKQELVRAEGELRFNEALIEERDSAIAEISGQIGEVHQIFQDLAVLVHDQGEALDDIEANLTRAADSAAGARVQVVRAARSQRAARRTWCFMAALAAGVLVVLVLVLAS